MIKHKVIVGLLALITSHASLSNEINLTDTPHFYIQMQNRTSQNISISFEKGVGNISLEPELQNETQLTVLNPKSDRYGVVIKPMHHENTFNIIFRGKEACKFTLGFYAPGKPKVEIKGLGCVGAGYELIDNRKTLLLFVSEMNIS